MKKHTAFYWHASSLIRYNKGFNHSMYCIIYTSTVILYLKYVIFNVYIFVYRIDHVIEIPLSEIVGRNEYFFGDLLSVGNIIHFHAGNVGSWRSIYSFLTAMLSFISSTIKQAKDFLSKIMVWKYYDSHCIPFLWLIISSFHGYSIVRSSLIYWNRSWLDSFWGNFWK